MPQIAYRAIRSRRKFVKAPEIKKRLGQEIDTRIKPHFIQRFEFVVANWDHKPEFKARKRIAGDFIAIYVYPAGPHKEIWYYVSKGTKAHIIRAKNAPVLAFAIGYKPKTKPPGKFGGPGTTTGPTVFAREVKHPGTEAREFEKNIAEDEQDWWRGEMESIWRSVLRAV